MEMPAKRSRWGSRLLPFLLALILCGGPTLRAFASQEQQQPEASAEQSEKPAKKERKAEAANRLPAVRWRNPGDTASLDLLNGAGGDKDAPDPRADYTVVKEDLHWDFNKYRQDERIEQDEPIRDAVWIGTSLARLTPQQIRDAFRAAGYQPNDVDGFAKLVEKRIAVLNQLKE
jgi:hypothetical protein